MANTQPLWWTTPLQAYAVVGAAIMFGGSALQSPLTMPMLQLPDTPVHHVGKQTEVMLHKSEFIFPPINAGCTLSNLIVGIVAYRARNTSLVAAEKLPWIAGAFALSVATTAYTLGIMAPWNRTLVRLSKKLDAHVSDEVTEKQFRDAQASWKSLNYGRAAIMLGNSVVAVVALLAGFEPLPN